MRFIITALISLFFAIQPGTAAASNADLTAREFFEELPSSIFESTVEGLSAPERDTLLRQGFSENWEISGEDKDIIVFSSLPFSDTVVALRLFYNDRDDSVIGIIGTVGAPICVLEAWKKDKNGRTTLADLPDEPDAREFLARGEKLPKGIEPSVTLCLGLNGLSARTVFWSSRGIVNIPVAKKIRFVWNGHEFVKTAEDAAPAASEAKPEETPASQDSTKAKTAAEPVPAAAPAAGNAPQK